MTRYEQITHRINNLHEAYARCFHNGLLHMGNMFKCFAYELVYERDMMTIEEAEEVV